MVIYLELYQDARSAKHKIHYVCVCVCVYIYIYRERERGREIGRERERDSVRTAQ